MRSKLIAILSIVILSVPLASHANPGLSVSWSTLDDSAGTGTTLSGISGNQIIGYYQDAENNINVNHSFLYDGTTFSPLNDPQARNFGTNRTVPTGISGNNITGFYLDSNTQTHGFVFDGTSWKTLDEPNALLTQGGTNPTAISGTSIVGIYYDSNDGHGFLDTGSNYFTLTPPTSGYSAYPSGVSGNNIVGEYNTQNGPCFLYDGTTWKTFEDPLASPGTTSATGIDGSNIVGYYSSPTGYHSFLYNGTTFFPLDDPSADEHGGHGTLANGISGNEIVGYYITATGDVHGFIATVPEPPSLLLAIFLGVALLGWKFEIVK